MIRSCLWVVLVVFSLVFVGCSKPVGTPSSTSSQVNKPAPEPSKPATISTITADISAGKYESAVSQCGEMLDALEGVDCFDSIAVNHPLEVATDPWIGTGKGINIRGYPWENPDIAIGRVPWKTDEGPKAPTSEALYQLQRHDRDAVLLFYYRAKALRKLDRTDEAADDYAHAYELVSYEQYCTAQYGKLHVRREYHSVHATKYDSEQVKRVCKTALTSMGRSLPGE